MLKWINFCKAMMTYHKTSPNSHLDFNMFVLSMFTFLFFWVNNYDLDMVTDKS